MKPFFTYFGGKYRTAPKYPAPEHAAIIEPFAGAAGYAVRHHTRAVTLCDLNPVISGLWKYLTKVSSAEIRAIPLLRNDQSVDDLGAVPQEAKHLVGFWLNKGTSSPTKRPSAWMRAGTHVNSYWGEAIRERIAEQVEHIRHWRIVEGSYERVHNRYATWFIDPPYQLAGKNYRHSAVDFAALSDWSRSRLGQVIVCENTGATWLPFEHHITTKSMPRSDAPQSREAVYTMRNELPPNHEHFRHYEQHRKLEEAWFAAKEVA